MVVGRRMRRRSCTVVRGRRPGAPALATSARCRCVRRNQPHALGSSAGVRGHGAAGRAGGAAPQARPQNPSFHIGMGEAAETAGRGGPHPGDGGAGRARALGGRGRAARPAAQHTAAGRRVRTGRQSAVASPLSASRADAQQLPAAAQQVRERRAGVGGGRGARGAAAQEGRAAAEGHPLVGAHGRAHHAGLCAALRHGAAAAARRVTSHTVVAYIPCEGPRARPEYYRLGIYCSARAGPRAVRVTLAAQD